MSTVFNSPLGRSLFLHIPKTGGSWVERVLHHYRISGLPNNTARSDKSRHALPKRDENFDFIFTFVRHPLGWYESFFRMQYRRWKIFEPKTPWHPQRCLEPYADDDFNIWMRAVAENEPAYVTRMFEWFVGPEGSERVDFVGRQENLLEDTKKLLGMLGQDVQGIEDIPPVNVGDPGTPIQWDGVLRDFVSGLEAPAIRRFYENETK